MLDQIIKQKIPCYFISPHLDDAAFSAGGLLDKLSGKVPITIINVFTSAGGNPNTYSAKQFLKQCGADSIDKLFNDRQIEDNQALKTWDLKVKNLGYTDAMWRRHIPSSHFPAEFGANYPTYRFHVVSGTISQYDIELIKSLGKELRKIIKEKVFYIFAPIGFGNHADHLVVRTAVSGTFSSNQVVYWSDFPYYFRNSSQSDYLTTHKYKSFIVKPNFAHKLSVAKKYFSQYSAVITDPKTLANDEQYFYDLAKIVKDNSLSNKLRLHMSDLFHHPKDYLFSYTYSAREHIHIYPFDPEAKIIADQLIKSISKISNSLEVKLIGSTGLGIAGQGDIDIIAKTGSTKLVAQIKEFSKLFGKPAKTRHDLVQWKLEMQGRSIDLDLMSEKCDRYQEQLDLFNYLNSSEIIKQKYEDFKWRQNGVNIQDYVRAQINFFDDLLSTRLPEAIGSYRLEQEILSGRNSSNYKYAIYKNKTGEKAFAKIWLPSLSSKGRSSLIYEINIYKAFANLRGARVKFPMLLESYISKQCVVMLIEHIEGDAPSTLTLSDQLNVFEQVLNYLKLAGQKLSKPTIISTRTPWYFALIFPLISLRAIIRQPAQLKLITLSIRYFYAHFLHFVSDQRRALTHRDLGNWNIKIDQQQIWLFDFQLMTYAHPLVEHVIISLKLWENKPFIAGYWNSKSFQAVASDPNQAKLFKLYSIVFALYDLSLSDGGDTKTAINYLSTIMQKPTLPAVKKSSALNTRFGVVISFLLFAAIFIFSLRGNLGTPDPTKLNSNAWKDNGPFELSPERGRYALTYSLVEDKSFYFSVPLARFVTPDLGYHNGHYVSLFAPGVSYLVMPGYVLGKIFGSAQIGSFAVITLFALANGYLIYLLTRRLGVPKIIGLISAGLFLFATPAFAYGVSLYQHHISTFLVLTSLYLAISYNNWLSLTIIWFLCAASIPVDYPNLVLMLPIGIYALGQLVHIRIADHLTINFKVLRIFTFLSMALPLAFFMYFNQASYGNPLQFSGTVQSATSIDEFGNPQDAATDKQDKTVELKAEKHEKSAVGFFKSRSLLNGLYILILSPDRGVIYFAPVLLLGILGIYFVSIVYPSASVVMASIVTANILLYSLWGDPWGGWAFGARYLIPSYAIMAVFLGVVLAKYRKNLIYLVIFLTASFFSIYVNTAGALSSSANPPRVQVLELEKLSGRQERFSFDRNIEYLKANPSKSFIYRNYLGHYFTSWQYFELILATLAALLFIGTIIAYFSKDSKL